MEKFINDLVGHVMQNLQLLGPFFGFFLVLLESIVPALPLSVFIALNVGSYGFVIGFFLSYFATCLGCILSYLLFYHIGTRESFQRRFLKRGSKLSHILKRVEAISFPNLVLIVALPFTPAFLVNIACGIAKVKRKKYYMALFLGKLSIVFFWSFIGKSLLESITDIGVIITVSILLLLMYVVSKLVSKKMKLE